MPIVDWNDIRKKLWHLLLALAAAYAAQKPNLQWAVPVLTMAAGISQPPLRS